MKILQHIKWQVCCIYVTFVFMYDNVGKLTKTKFLSCNHIDTGMFVVYFILNREAS